MPDSNGCDTQCTQIDNAAYAVGLSERIRTRVEEFGRVQPRDTEAAALVRSKTVHVVLLVVAVLVAVWSGNGAIVFLAPFLAFWLGGVAEAVASQSEYECWPYNDTVTGQGHRGRVVVLSSSFLVSVSPSDEEAVAMPGARAAEKIKGVGKVTAAAVLGVVGIVILIVAAGGAIALKNSVGVMLR